MQQADDRTAERCRRLRDEPVTACVPILLVSEAGGAACEDAPEGADAQLSCPSPPVLQAMIRALLCVRARADRAAARTRAEHHAVLQATTEGLVVLDRDGRLVDMNPAALAMHGFDDVEPLRRQLPELQQLLEVRTLEGEPLPVESWPMVRALRGEVFTGYEVRVRHRQGGREWVGSFGGTAVKDAAGRMALAIVSVRDVTAQREAETATREREELLRLALSASGAGAWAWDLRSGALRWSDEYFRLFGFDPERDTPSVEAAVSRVHPDDRAEVDACVEEAVERGTRIDIVHRVNCPDGSVRWVRGISKAFFEGERPSRLTGIAIDVTEHKRSEEALRRREAELRTLAEHSPEVIARFDRQLRHTYLNAYGARVYGVSAERALGRTNTELGMPADKVAFWNSHFEQVFASGQQRTVDFEFESPSFGHQYFSSLFVPEKDERGFVQSILAITRDVSERRRADEALRESEQRLNSVIENLSVGLLVCDLEGRTLHWNRAALQMHGYAGDEDELSYLSRLGEIYELRTPEGEAVPFAEWPISRLLRGETFRERALRVRDTRRGWERVFSYTGGLIPGGSANATLALLSIRDITERRRAEEALRESEERFRAFAEGIPHLTFITDAAGSLTYTNGRFFEYFGIPPSRPAPSGWTSPLLYHPADVQPTLEAWAAGLRSGGTFRIDSRLRRHDGQYRWHATQVGPVRDDSGRLTMWVGTTTDIHDRREAVRATELANAQLREADRRKNDFLAVLSHELRNPLAPIRNSVYLLEHAAPGGAQARHASEVIERQTRQLTRLVDDLLEVTRITQGKIRLQREVLELNALVRRCAEDHRQLFANAGVVLQTDIPGEPVHVDGDPDRLAQVVGNLLTNAAKFTPQGGRARLSLELVEEGRVAVRVSDNGVGLAPELLEKVFDPFVQAEATLDRTRGGLGLGLAVLKGLVVLHGGAVSARSDGRGRGAEFVVTLPRAPVDEERRSRERRREALQNARRILLIEDNTDAALSLKAVLELKGHEVVLAQNGPEGVEKARSTRPDVVLCDIGLPGMDGFQVARALREDPAFARTRLVALSGYALPEDVERARAAGFDRHLAKPVDPDDLLVAL
ncbi:MAG TPA: PAS domain S-box protein [Vicinamibacteria bacterium]|nr:PAS domain S-box protein [Vicinamibacteria bacterium]